MTLEQLRVFVAVAERQHVTRAAEALNLAQSAASAAIASLESRNGTKLFHRVGRHIELTEVGRAFLGEAKAVLARVAAAELMLAEFGGLVRGTLSVCASQTIAGYWLPRHLADYRRAHPGIEVQLTVGNTAQVAAAIHDGAAELGFVEGAVFKPTLVSEEVARDQLVLVVGMDHPWAGRARAELTELASVEWVLREPGSGTRSAFEDELARAGMNSPLRVAMELPSNEAVRAAVEAGAGATVISASVVASSLEAGLLHRVPLDLPDRAFTVLRHRDRHCSRTAAALLARYPEGGSPVKAAARWNDTRGCDNLAASQTRTPPLSLMSFLGKQFIDVLQWNEEGPGVLAWRYPMQDQEIQNGAVLVVRETQFALFIKEGKIADLFRPGSYTLTTATLPVLTYLQNWDKFFESPFKSDVFFFSIRDQIDQRWGTPEPITVRDKEFGALRIRANGVYSYKLVEPVKFWEELSGTTPVYTVADAANQLRAIILTTMASTLGGSNIAFLDMAAQQGALSATLKAAIAPVFETYGLELTSFYLQSLSLPEEVQERLDRASSMRVIGDMNKYTQYEAAESLRVAAANPGGVAGAGAGLGAGMMMAQAIAGAAPHPPAASTTDVLATLERLAELLGKGVLTQAEFDAKKTELLAQIR